MKIAEDLCNIAIIQIKQNRQGGKEIGICPLLLTFLDLYHFPLRGQEQAEFIAQRAPELKHIYKHLKHK